MPRDVAKLSEVGFHKSVSVFIPSLGSGRIPIEKRGGGSFSANHCRGHPSARRARRGKKTARRPGLDARDVPVGETSRSRFFPVGAPSLS